LAAGSPDYRLTRIPTGSYLQMMVPDRTMPSPWMLLPFVLLLAVIALAPMIWARGWAKHYPKIAYVLGAVTVSYYLFGLHAYAQVLETAHEYVSFVVLIGSLYVVSGGIHVNVRGEATPLVNTAFLLIGAVISNLLGTTGASMLLIRPWLRMNRHRVSGHHIAFFIFIVSNVGGCLTPIGDPPLFLGFLKGIPFWWVAASCWPIWLVGVGFLLALFYCIDAANYRRALVETGAEPAGAADGWRFEGLWNLALLLVILGAVFIHHPVFLREALMAAAAAASYLTTRKEVHAANHFHFHPLQEVAILFLGIFATMMPALDWLQAHAAGLVNPSPGLFYWGAGTLSGFLDNAPTYMCFFSAALGLVGGLDGAASTDFAKLLGPGPFHDYLLAISIGAVFFGATTYIGNGPNFMVKSIADRQQVRTPGFLEFFFRYTLPCMGPMLALVWLLFFR
jgi:Na+/H+ antiporter NhaD/arsenite permease-like protein